MAEFHGRLSPDIPWHVTAFHQDYRMTDPANTTPECCCAPPSSANAPASAIVYAGNQPPRVGGLENTRCPTCHTLLVERLGYLIRGYHLTAEGRCPGLRSPRSPAAGTPPSTARSPPTPSRRDNRSPIHLFCANSNQ